MDGLHFKIGHASPLFQLMLGSQPADGNSAIRTLWILIATTKQNMRACRLRFRAIDPPGAADKQNVMPTASNVMPAQSEIRFLEYRLEVVKAWPPSARKLATGEAITRRLLSIGRLALTHPEVEDLLADACRLLEAHFSADPQGADGIAHFSPGSVAAGSDKVATLSTNAIFPSR